MMCTVLEESQENSSVIKHCIPTPKRNIRTLTDSMAYETRRFNVPFARAQQIFPILRRINPIRRIDTYLFKVHSNIVLLSTPRPP